MDYLTIVIIANINPSKNSFYGLKIVITFFFSCFPHWTPSEGCLSVVPPICLSRRGLGLCHKVKYINLPRMSLCWWTSHQLNKLRPDFYRVYIFERLRSCLDSVLLKITKTMRWWHTVNYHEKMWRTSWKGVEISTCALFNKYPQIAYILQCLFIYTFQHQKNM